MTWKELLIVAGIVLAALWLLKKKGCGCSSKAKGPDLADKGLRPSMCGLRRI